LDVVVVMVVDARSFAEPPARSTEDRNMAIFGRGGVEMGEGGRERKCVELSDRGLSGN
jgi:hypothetical protein